MDPVEAPSHGHDEVLGPHSSFACGTARRQQNGPAYRCFSNGAGVAAYRVSLPIKSSDSEPSKYRDALSGRT